MRKNIRKAAAFAAVFFCLFVIVAVPAAAQDSSSGKSSTAAGAAGTAAADEGASAAGEAGQAEPAPKPEVLAAGASALKSLIGPGVNQKDVLVLYKGAPAACTAALQKALALTAEGKWKSAYELLSAYDADSADPYALAMRTEICVEGYVQSEMHQHFALKDLGEGESLSEVRAGKEQFTPFDFDPVALCEAQTKAGITPPAVLERALGDYYYSVDENFEGGWVNSDQTIIAGGVAHYIAAEKQGLKDALGFRRHGELMLKTGDAWQADALLRASILLNADDGSAHASLAEALADEGQNDAALAEVEKTLALLPLSDRNPRFSAYVLGARICRENQKVDESNAYIGRAEKEFSDIPNPGIIHMLLALQDGAADEANAAADKVYASFPTSPYVVRSILMVWLQNQDGDSPMAFLDRQLKAQDGKAENMAVLQFYKAVLLNTVKGVAGNEEAIALLDKAEANFKTAYKPDNEVFATIAQLKQEYADGIAQAKQEAEDAAAQQAASQGSKPADGSQSGSSTQSGTTQQSSGGTKAP